MCHDSWGCKESDTTVTDLSDLCKSITNALRARMQPLALSPFSCPPLYKQSFYFIYSFFKINFTI